MKRETEQRQSEKDKAEKDKREHIKKRNIMKRRSLKKGIGLGLSCRGTLVKERKKGGRRRHQ